MREIILTTYDWVPDAPRGYVRDLRVRWALEEARLPYRVESTPFRDRKEADFAHQPFGQTPWITDGGVSISETARSCCISGKERALMPADAHGRGKVVNGCSRR